MVNRVSYYVNLLTYFGPPHSIAEARTIGSADMATGSMVRELFSTALCTSCDSCGWTVINIKLILSSRDAVVSCFCTETLRSWPQIWWRRGTGRCLLCRCDSGMRRNAPDLDFPSTLETRRTEQNPSAKRKQLMTHLLNLVLPLPFVTPSKTTKGYKGKKKISPPTERHIILPKRADYCFDYRKNLLLVLKKW